MKNKLSDVRNLLIEQMEALRDVKPGDERGLKHELEKARAMAEIGKVLTDTARVEVEALELIPARDRGFGTGFVVVEGNGRPALESTPVRN